MVLKGVNRVHYDKIRSNGLEKIQLSTQCKHVCIHAPYTHAYTTKYHHNVRYTQLAFPLYSMKHQVMRDLCWISCFCCFTVKSAVLFSEKCSFMKGSYFQWKAQLHEKRNEKHSAFQWKVQPHGANGLERSQLGTQYKNGVTWYWK